MRRVFMLVMWLTFALGSVCFASDDYIRTDDAPYVGSFGDVGKIIASGTEWEQTSPYDSRVNPVSGNWQELHNGVDIAIPTGTALSALGRGVVTASGWNDGYGNWVMVHYSWALNPDGTDAGMEVMYAHCDAVVVDYGDIVNKGDVVAYSGSTGNSTGPHLHLTIYYGGQGDERTIDPAAYFTNLTAGSGSGSGGGAYQKAMDRTSDVNIQLKIDAAKPIREVIETIVKAATTGLHLLETGGIRNLFTILITIDLALALIFYNIDSSMREQTPLMAYLCFKFLFYGFLLLLLTHWGEFVGNFSKNLFSEAAGIMTSRSPEQIAAAISSPTDIIQKGLSIVTPIFNQCLKDSLSPALGFVILLTLLILLLFLIIGWHIALAYIEFYLMVLFGFTTFVFAGEKHTRIHSENGINGIIASSINLMFFCFFSITLQGVMAELAVDSVFTVGGRDGQEIVYRHPAANDPDNAGIPHGAEGLAQFMAKIRKVESFGGRYYCHVDPSIAVDPETFGAYQVLNSENWNQWAQEYIEDTGDNPPLDTDFSLVPTSGFEEGPPYYEGPPPSGYQYPGTPRNQDLICGNKMLRLYADKGNWRGVAEFWIGDASGDYWAKVSGATASAAANTAIGRTAINTGVLLKLFLVVLMFMFIGDRIGQAVMNTFGSRGFTFRMNS
ncbi:MAG: M23 family metallopeptidase [Schwartzia sp.]|nr:M23 family metallopeptidase [Schwartzia sp. (in: firmicutes)]